MLRVARTCPLERTEGALRLGFVARDGETVAHETFQAGALRVRFPRPVADCEAIVLNTAGGLTGGDVLDIELGAGPGARALVSTQACEKIYDAGGDTSVIATAITVDAGAALEYLPQPTILFDGACLSRATRVSVAADGKLLALEAGILGRTAMNEEFRSGALRDAWRITRDGRLVFADTLALTPDTLSPWALGDARAYATVIYVGPDSAERLDLMRSLLAGATAGASSWNGVLVARLLAADGYQLMRTLGHVLHHFRGRPLPRLWHM